MARHAASAALAACALLGTAPAASAASRDRDLPPPLGRVEFDREGYARIPFDLRVQHVWIRGTVNASDSVWIVVDTGAGGTTLDEGLARQLGMRLGGTHQTRGSGGTQASRSVRDVTIRIPGLSIHRKSLEATAIAGITAPGGRPMQVIVGYELFRSCTVRFDYAAGIMEVWESGRSPQDLPGTVVPMQIEENNPYVEGTLQVAGRAPIRGRFVIDSGSTQALMIAPEVVERESLAIGIPTIEVSGRGVGGESRSRVGRAEAFVLGDLSFERPVMALTSPGLGRISVPGSIGNIGGQVLMRCRVTFDYSHRRVLFEPAADFHRPFEADMSGATFSRVDSTLEVRIVNPGTPADEAGLQVGDRVIRLDGEAARQVDLPTLRRRLQEPGRTLELEVLRGTERSNHTLVLRRLI